MIKQCFTISNNLTVLFNKKIGYEVNNFVIIVLFVILN